MLKIFLNFLTNKKSKQTKRTYLQLFKIVFTAVAENTSEIVYSFQADKAPLVKRGLVRDPLLTGIYAVDMLVPVGLGQRQLILGDRQKGKISMVLDIQAAVWQQNGFFNVCSSNTTTAIAAVLFCFIGRRLFEIKNLVLYFEQVNPKIHGILHAVFTSAGDPATHLWIAPFISATSGEFLILRGLDAVIFFCDLTRHANAHRQISLLIGRSPAREAYPGDVFYLHARLLERCARLGSILGSGSLTGIPVVETQNGQLSAYIPTNIISITDGQIYLNTKIFKAGIAPAIDTGLSVSRIGSVAQLYSVQFAATETRKEFAWWRFLDRNRQFKEQFQDEEKDMLLWGDFAMWFIVQEKLSQLPSIKSLGMLLCVRDGFFECYVDSEKERIFVERLLKYKRKADRASQFASALKDTSLEGLEYASKIEDIRGFNLELFDDRENDTDISFLNTLPLSDLGFYYFVYLELELENNEEPETTAEIIYPERNIDLAQVLLLSQRDFRPLLKFPGVIKIDKKQNVQIIEDQNNNENIEEKSEETETMQQKNEYDIFSQWECRSVLDCIPDGYIPPFLPPTDPNLFNLTLALLTACGTLGMIVADIVCNACGILPLAVTADETCRACFPPLDNGLPEPTPIKIICCTLLEVSQCIIMGVAFATGVLIYFRYFHH